MKYRISVVKDGHKRLLCTQVSSANADRVVREYYSRHPRRFNHYCEVMAVPTADELLSLDWVDDGGVR